ncbi:MAG: DUF4390 domain-containing protein [Proteobacteria bacterium]|nr:DUF4390 domain-containing protein [Pseudomonadota bacterium]
MLIHKLLKAAGLIILLSCICNLSFAKTINIKSTHAYTEESIYYLDTLFDFKLTEEANKALLHGIPLEIHTVFQLRLKRKWLWDRTISENKIIYKLEHKPLTNNFLIIDINTGLRSSYNNLDAALNHINTISKMKLFDQNILQKDNDYVARIKTYLDTGSLPPPLRPQAYFSSKWDMSSEWFEWKVIK